MKPLMDFDLTDSMSKAEGVQKIDNSSDPVIFTGGISDISRKPAHH